MEAERSQARTDALQGEEARALQHLVFFLPYLQLKTRHSIAGVDFSPFREPDGRVTPHLESAERALSRILSSYIDRHGKPYDNCVVATIPDRGWDLNRSDGPTIFWSTSLLFLASWASNQYFPRFFGSYTNSSSFRIIAQAFSGNEPVYMAVGARRRDGDTWDGGYRHGELRFSTPAQCPPRGTQSQRATAPGQRGTMSLHKQCRSMNSKGIFKRSWRSTQHCSRTRTAGRPNCDSHVTGLAVPSRPIGMGVRGADL